MKVGDGRELLFVEDDDALRARMGAALRRRGFVVTEATSVPEALTLARAESPELALVDLRLGDGDGLHLVRDLHQLDPHTNIVVLTGYGSIATAMEAVHAGATWFLTKPANADDVLAAFARGDEALREALGLPAFDLPDRPIHRAPSLARMEWEHIQRVLTDHGGNVSHAAEALGIHRRSLQRKLGKRPNIR